jgi:hypothetical protein
MRTGRCLLAILLLAATFTPALAGAPQRKPIDCCPDGQTMACCRNASGCTLERCDGRGVLPAPVSVTAFLLPVAAGPALPDRSDLQPDSPAAAPRRPVLERPDPPPRG